MCGISVVPNHFVFRPPFNIKELTDEACRTNVYCKNYVNGLDWKDGDVDYNDVESVLAPLNEYKYIFVVGRDKKRFLEKYINTNIVNLEDKIKLRTCRNYFTNCSIHSEFGFKCAINNVFKIFVFIEQNWNKNLDIIYDEIK